MLESTCSAGDLQTSLEFSRSRVERFVSLSKNFGTMGHAIKAMFYNTNLFVS